MKRFLTATALTTLVATGATAATEGEAALINSYLPQVSVDALTEAQVDQLVSMAHSGDSRSEKVARMQSLITMGNPVDLEAPIPVIERLQAYAPDIDYSSYSDAELAQAAAIVNAGGSRAETVAQLTSFELERGPITVDPLTETEIVQIRSYAPGIDIAALTDREILLIQAAIASGDRTQIDTVLSTITAG